MIEFHGRPFLEYVVELLAAQGFSRILMLLGYLPDVITQHFGDGRRFGVEIEYAVTGVEDETGQRLRDAETLLDPVFMLLYCDNIWPLSFDRLWQHFVSKDALVQVTAYRNADKYTRDNLAIDADGFVSTYDKSRTKPGLAGVDIGFFIVRREALRLLPPGNRSFEAEVLPRLVTNRQLCAFVFRQQARSQ